MAQVAQRAVLQKNFLDFTDDDGNAGTFSTVSRITAADNLFTLTGQNNSGTARLTGLTTPSADADAATKKYVDDARSGLLVKEACEAATTASAGNISSFDFLANAGPHIDGVTLVAGDRVLIKNQTDTTENGIYVVRASGSDAERAADATTSHRANGAFTFVTHGTTNGNQGFVFSGSSDSDFNFGAASITHTVSKFSGGLSASADTTFTGANQFSGSGNSITRFHNGIKLASGNSAGAITYTNGSGGANETALDLNDINNAVKKTGAETVEGEKTFSDVPKFSSGIKLHSNASAGAITYTDGASGHNATALDLNDVVTTTTSTVSTIFKGLTVSGDSGIAVTHGTAGITVDGTNGVTAVLFTATSDRRLKQNIKYTDPSDALRQVMHMRPATYQFKSEPEKSRQGVIAQELMEVAPSLVDTVNKGTEKEHMAVNYIDMISSLIGAVQGLQAQIDELRAGK